jgi:membrane-associated phospholipid phosphatase
MQIQTATGAPLVEQVDLQARLGIALADAFIGCWNAKFDYDLLRPVTYIRATMDPKWEPILITPPFPEYPSGHSTQSGAAAEVLTAFFGEDFAFEDATHLDDGLKPRQFSSFRAAAQEAGMSRLYGGIHFRSAIDQGLEQGRCIGRHVVALQTRTR